MRIKYSDLKRKAEKVEEEVEDVENQSEGEEEGEASRPNKKTKKDDVEDEDEDTSEGLQGKWSKAGTLITYITPAVKASTKIAGFDFDSTLVNTKSNKKFATGPSDWQPFCATVKSKLTKLVEDGYKLVIFSNQGGISKGKLSPENIKGRVEGLMKYAGVEFEVYLATAEDGYRKPGPEMWNYMVKNHNDGKTPSLEDSMYIGDAAGRPENKQKKKKKDFSCSDRKFALNTGVKFQTPEEFFLGEDPEPYEIGVDPHQILKNNTDEEALKKYENIAAKEQEMVICVGFPASGKSTFSKRYLVSKGYVHVNQDTLGTPAKCKNAAKEALAAGKSVVIDNTNPGESKRAEYIQIAENAGISKIRCFYFETPRDLAEHLNMFRERLVDVKHVPDIAYNMYKKNFSEPSKSEGFTEIVKIKWVPKFDNEESKKLFLNYT